MEFLEPVLVVAFLSTFSDDRLAVSLRQCYGSAGSKTVPVQECQHPILLPPKLPYVAPDYP
eukprot:935736-Prorocentrum_lima.AAC.1